MRKYLVAATLFVLMLFAGASGAFATTLYTAGAEDGWAVRDWYSSPNYYVVDTTSATIQAYHDGSNRQLYRGLVIFDVSTLAGSNLDPNSASLNFYSFGFSGVQLQYGGATGFEVTTGAANAGGSLIADLTGVGEGWQSFDVTSFMQPDITAGTHYIGFVFNAVVNGGGGSLAASEDASGRGAFLQVGSAVGAVPEPESYAMLLAGLGLMGWIGRRRKL